MTEPQTPITLEQVKEDTAPTLTMVNRLYAAMTDDESDEMSTPTPSEMMLEAINLVAERVYLIDQKQDTQAAQIEALTHTINDLVTINKALIEQLTTITQK